MSAQARPTPGAWVAVITDEYGCEVECNGEGIAWILTQNEADAVLIAEAGAVLHETGRTPRQLVEERAELLEVLCDVLRIAKAASIGVTGNAKRIARADAAIAKTKRDRA